jgi:predicted ribosome quality control (RQC) complex YloA/Tae2 family protein
LVFDGPHGPVRLIIEAIGRYSNLVLVGEDGTVLDAIKRVGPELNRYRVMLPNHAYVPPPPQDKLLLADVTEYRLRGLLAQWPPDTPLRKALVGGVAGISPLASAEIVFRALGDADAPVKMVQRVAPLLQAFRRLTLKPSQPCIVYDETELVAFAPYALTHMENWEPVKSISAAVAAYYDRASDSYQAAKAPLLKAIASGRARLARRREKLKEEQEGTGDPNSLRRMGEAILAHAHQIEPGQSELVVEWVTGDGPKRVKLDPRMSPSENAQDYFRRYRKAQRRVAGIPARVAQVASEEAYLDQLALDLTMAESRPGIDTVAAALVEAGYLKQERKRPPARTGGPLRFESPDGLLVWVGKNAWQNDEVTFRRASSDALWLHARGMPGAHVIVQSDGRRIPEQTIKWAAALAAHYSRGRDDTQVAVDVVERRHVRRLKDGRPGQVVYRNERTLWIRPQAPL